MAYPLTPKAYAEFAQQHRTPWYPVTAMSDAGRALLNESSVAVLLSDCIIPATATGNLASSGKSAAYVVWLNVYTRDAKNNVAPNNVAETTCKAIATATGGKGRETKARTVDTATKALAALVKAVGAPKGTTATRTTATRKARKASGKAASQAATATPAPAPTVAERLAANGTPVAPQTTPTATPAP